MKFVLKISALFGIFSIGLVAAQTAINATSPVQNLFNFLFNNISQAVCTTACPAGQVCRQRVAGFNLQCGPGSGTGNNYTLPATALATATTSYATQGLQYGLWLATNWFCILWRGVAGCPGNPLALIQGCYCAFNATTGPLAYNNATASCVPVLNCTQGSFSFY